MSNTPLATRPPDTVEAKLKEKYAESFAAQSDLMDQLARQLIGLQLAIPGIYATALKLVTGEKGTVTVNLCLLLTFGFWVMSLGATLLALFPRPWNVDPTILQRDPNSVTDKLGIKDFYVESARYKRNRLVIGTLLFFAGIATAALTVA